MQRVSLPREHGAYLTLAGAASTAALVAPAPSAALAVGLTLGMAFLLRGPLERRARGGQARGWDAPAMAIMAVLAVAGAAVAATSRLAVVPVLAIAALALPGAALL